MIMNGEVDFVFLLGGICNLTAPIYENGRRFFWLNGDRNILENDFTQALIDISTEISNLNIW